MSFSTELKLQNVTVLFLGTIFATPAQLRQWAVLKPTTITSSANSHPRKGKIYKLFNYYLIISFNDD